MKRVLNVLAMMLAASVIVVACGGSAKEIPMDKMAKITLKLVMEGKIEKDKSPNDLENTVVEPYAKEEGFTAADFKHTANMIDKDEKKQKEFEEVIGKLMMEEMMKALGGSDLGKMMQGATDSAATSETKKEEAK